MSVSASLENARRNLMALRRMAARPRLFDLAGVIGGVAAILFCLELVYLCAANLIVRSSLIKDAVGSADGFALDYSSAYSLWPGHVVVRDVSVRVEDFNVQFEVALDRAELDIALSELAFKKFHVTRLVGEGTRFRMRHKILSVGADAERIAAFPPIQGFADPPYYVGLRPPKIPDSEYDLWSVRIQNVTARVSELWVLEHRFRGEGVARGSFVVKPARWVQVEPAELVLERGSLTLGEHRVAERVSGKITCDIPDMHVQETDGVQVLRDIAATLHLELTNGDLDFLRAYLGRLAPIDYSGRADWLLDLNVQRGRIEPGSHVALRATPLRLQHREKRLEGDVMVDFGRNSPASNELALVWAAPQMRARRGADDERGPEVRGLSGALRISGTDLKQTLALGELRAGVSEVSVPSLGWFDAPGIELDGKGSAAFQLARDSHGALSGQASFRASTGRVRRDEVLLGANLDANLGFLRAPGSETFDFQRLELQLTQAFLRSGTKHSEPFALRVDGAGLRLSPGMPRASGVVKVSLSSTEALLPLLMADPIKDVTGAALDLQRLEARASLLYAGENFDLRVLEAESGRVRLRGYLSKRERPLGAFLLSSGPINVGVTLVGGETEISPFVSDEWLVATWSRLLGDQRRPG